MSWFGALVVPLKLEKHPDADSLSICSLEQPFETTVVVRTQDWEGRDRAVYIMPDSVVSDEPEFAFLGSKKRVKACKLRGVFSNGLLVPARAHHQIGDEVSEEMGVVKYDDTLPLQPHGDVAHAPSGEIKYTDIESLRKYGRLFVQDEPVVITEKIHGMNFRVVFQDGQLYAGSHRQWLKDGDNQLWRVVRDYGLEQKCSKFPNVIFFGEIYGWVQDLRYGCGPGQQELRLFDAFSISTGKFYDYEILDDTMGWLNGVGKDVSLAPVLYKGGWQGFDAHAHLAEGQSTLADCVREGFVVRPLQERWDKRLGRLILKLHGEGYLLRDKTAKRPTPGIRQDDVAPVGTEKVEGTI